MRRGEKSLCIFVVVLAVAVLSAIRGYSYESFSYEFTPGDSIQEKAPRTIARSYRDVERENPFDLRNPSTLKSEFVYDPKSNLYYYTTTLNGRVIGTPIAYTPEQYKAYRRRHENRNFFLLKEREEAQEKGKNRFNPFDFGFELGPAEKIFGPGGVKVRTQGSAEIVLGVKSNKTDNPSMPQHARSHTFFNFDEKIQANLNASVGSKLNFNLNYNTESTFDFDTKRLKLAYEGEEDDIVKLVEAGNVSLQPRNSLIRGGASLFGIQTKMQFGKLDLNMVISRQEAETKHVSSEGGVQTEPFEFSANKYDENRHFFLAHYFYEHYDEALATLPFISSGITINRVEVWVTNKRGRFESARNIVAFSDLAEPKAIYNSSWTPTASTQGMPDNRANSLYSQLLSWQDLRKIENTANVLNGRMKPGVEYEKLESARRLNESEYVLNSQLGYITLNSRVGNDEIVAVAFEYTYQGKVYRVGEFASDVNEGETQALFVKLVKGTTLTPSVPYWKLTMRNVYSLGAQVRDLSPEHFRLNVYYRSDSTGIALPYLTSTDLKGQLLIRVLGVDRLDSRNEPHADGVFDYVEGYTVNSHLGLIYFNSVEPFGKTLAKKLVNVDWIEQYCYPELYEMTPVAARQVAEKDKFLLRGEYKASQSGTISLGAMGVTPGSVRVTAGGVLLTENVDYTVNYGMGTVTIINESIINSGTRVDVSLENKGFALLQRKTMLGLDANYHLTPNMVLGATAMYLSEMPLTTKVAVGNESLRNFLWGANFSMDMESMRLTNILDWIPFLNLTKPSRIKLNAEFAHLVPGHYESKFVKGYSYVDDFETAQGSVDLMNPYAWSLASTPQGDENPLFPEASLSNDVKYGYHRARLAWFYIDPSFNRRRSSLMPSYMRNDPEYLSNHYSREVMMQELFPYRDYSAMALSYLSTLNLSYYPEERGPYNLNSEAFLPNGKLDNPKRNWGGIMRKIDQSDFESANIEYIEFWLLDPFIYNPNSEGGSLYINLGEVSEDILRDGLKFFENGLPINADPSAVKETVWGKVPLRQASGYAFDNSPGARAKQDLGFNGLSDEEEKLFPSYQLFLNKLQNKVTAQTLSEWKADPLSPLNDPAGDNFLHFRNSIYDEKRASILDRYKYFNGVQGNSAEATESTSDVYSIASRIMPDIEDVNQDNTLNENEQYYSYKVDLRPASLQVGSNYITDVRTSAVTLPNGKRESVNWYQFKIPIREYDKKVGAIQDFNSIRFIRLFLTDFKEETFLRFATLKLVRGTWRTYDRPLYDPLSPPSSEGSLVVSTVNLEENGDREPVSYVLPPGVLRSLDPAQAQATQQNEQSLSLKVNRLAPGDARAVYRHMGFDFRKYKKMELFVHAEKQIDDDTDTKPGDLSLFVRLGSDYTNNYYEYSVPLSLTPFGVYSSDVAQDRQIVWPHDNMLSFPFEILTNLKLERNAVHASATGEADLYRRFSKQDPNNPKNSITVIGNPSLSNVKTIMIGVRNNANALKSAEVWVNEFRLSDYREQGGMAGNVDMQVALSDWGSVNVRGQMQTAGFGALDETLSQRRLDDLRQVNVSTRLEMGRFFPAKAKVTIPLYYAYNDELITPLYNPLDEDVLLRRALSTSVTKQERDSIFNHSVKRTTTHSLSLSNMKVDLKSKTPMPYDPANLSFSYAINTSEHHSPELIYDRKRDWLASINYDYSPVALPWQPFKAIKSSNRLLSNLKSYRINYLPSKISLATSMVRHYSEQQSRNFIPGVGDALPIPATFVQNFLWDRSLSLNWNLTSNLQMSFQSGTNARIEEPYLQVNRQLEPDKYKIWQDSVRMSLRELGSPMKYDQRATISYKLPFELIPYMQWITGTASYTSSYNWDRGATLARGVNVGNVIRNDLKLEGNATLNFATLYRTIPFFAEIEKEVTQRQSSNSSRREGRNAHQDPRKSSRRPSRLRENKDSTDEEAEGSDRSTALQKPKSFVKDITLSPDSAIVVRHGLNDKRLHIVAKTHEGKTYSLKTKVIDANTISISNRDTVSLALVLQGKTKPKEHKPRSLFVSNLLYSTMMIRDINISYRRSQNFHIPGFMPFVGAAGGQTKTEQGLSPGLDFAFGLVGRGYVEHAAQQGWLTTSQNNVNPSVYTQGEDLNIRVTLEPIKDLRITLSALRNDTRREETQFVFEGMPKTFGGSFTMTTIGLKDFFSTAQADRGYFATSFQSLLDNRAIIAQRIYDEYQKSNVNTEGCRLKQNSADVLIPSFLAAYAGYGVNDVELSPFPSLGALLPNWSITYSGLSQIVAFQKLFRNFSLTHSYNATYSVGNYNSILGWQPLGEKLGDRGMVQHVNPSDPSTGESSYDKYLALPYDIPTVTLQEGFNPLLGLEITFANGVGASCRWNRRRALNLSPLSAQLMESGSNEITASLNYKVDDARKLFGKKKSSRRRASTVSKKRFQLFTSGGSLTLRLDYSYNRSSMLIRKIQENFTQATNGNSAHTIKVSADYGLSRYVTLRAFLDWRSNQPLVSSASFPTRNLDFGVSIRVSLTQ